MGTCERIAPLAGRILLALIFVMSGLNKFTGLAGTAGYIASKGLPMPQVLAIAAAVVELVGGVLLIVGWKARWAALALFVFTAIAALLFHNFWAVPPEQTQNQMIHFMKNLAIMGGLLYVVAYGGGPLSCECKRQ
ncbi:MAG: putative oxidoreductase [Proteobacteria bacterium]|nr:putative oxidoreductase [Pseudomonadota bacterium]